MRDPVERYKIVIWWSDVDERFIAEAPELPGCMSDGATQEDAVANIRVVAQEWIATARALGRQIPRYQTVAT